MKKTFLTVITISALLLSLMVMASHNAVRADSTDSIRFIDSGITIYSPVNMTYNFANLVLNLSLYMAGNLGSLDPQISMNYSVDGIYNGSVPLRSNGEIHVVTVAVGTTDLPELSNGSHYLTIYLYGLNQRTYEPKYLSYFNSIYLSTVGNPVLNPTINPPSSPTISPTASPTPSPSIPEFPFWIIPMLLVFTVTTGLLFYFKKHKRQKTIDSGVAKIT
jgi:hypothetical protein